MMLCSRFVSHNTVLIATPQVWHLQKGLSHHIYIQMPQCGVHALHNCTKTSLSYLFLIGACLSSFGGEGHLLIQWTSLQYPISLTWVDGLLGVGWWLFQGRRTWSCSCTVCTRCIRRQQGFGLIHDRAVRLSYFSVTSPNFVPKSTRKISNQNVMWLCVDPLSWCPLSWCIYTLSDSQGYLRSSSLLFPTLSVKVRHLPYTTKTSETNTRPGDQLSSQNITSRFGSTARGYWQNHVTFNTLRMRVTQPDLLSLLPRQC